MLTDEQIEEILFKYTSRQDEFNMSVIKVIADRLSRLADFDALNTLDREGVMRTDIKQINTLYGAYIKKQLACIRDDFWWIAMVIYALVCFFSCVG